MLKDISNIVSDPPTILGYTDINSVAKDLIDNSQGTMLDGYLLYAYKGASKDINSLVITTGYSYGELMISEVYSSYRMIYSTMKYINMDKYIESYSKDKKDSEIYNSLKDRFYENQNK